MSAVAEDSILAGLFDDVAWIRVIGRGTFQNACPLRDFAKKQIDEGRTHFVVDLEDCPYMDSTFMGTLTGIALRVKAKAEGCFQIINGDERAIKALQELGLDQILELDLDCKLWSDERDLVRENVTRSLASEAMPEEKCRKLVLEAHEALCQANQENVARFHNVLEYLKKPEDPQT